MAGRWWGMRCSFFQVFLLYHFHAFFGLAILAYASQSFRICICVLELDVPIDFSWCNSVLGLKALRNIQDIFLGVCEQWKPLRGQMVGSTESEEVSFCQVLAYFFSQWLYHCIGGLPFLSAAWSWLQRRILGEMMPQSKKCPERIHENKGPLERFPLNSRVPNHFFFWQKTGNYR